MIAPSVSPGEALRRSQELIADGRLDQAQALLDAAIQLAPGDPELHAALARARWIGGAGERFADPFRAAVSARPADLALRLKCADVLRLADMHAPAESLFREALTQSPGNVVVRAWLGVLLEETGRSEEALGMFQSGVEAFPGEPTLKLNLAHTLLRLGRPKEALGEIAAVRAARPVDQSAIAYQTIALRQLGDPRYRWLCDYDRHVQIYDLAAPPGYAEIGAFNRALGARLRGLQNLAAHPLDQTLRGGSQTGRDLLLVNDPVIRSYLAALEAPIRAYIGALDADQQHPLGSRRTNAHAIAGCWSVLLRPGGFHVNHIHSEGWISSAYYVSLPPGMASAGNQEGWIKFGESRWPIPGCGVERMVEPKEGRLVLFPSYMWHGTVPFASGERLTAPFDVVPVPGARS